MLSWQHPVLPEHVICQPHPLGPRSILPATARHLTSGGITVRGPLPNANLVSLLLQQSLQIHLQTAGDSGHTALPPPHLKPFTGPACPTALKTKVKHPEESSRPFVKQPQPPLASPNSGPAHPSTPLAPDPLVPVIPQYPTTTTPTPLTSPFLSLPFPTTHPLLLATFQ